MVSAAYRMSVAEWRAQARKPHKYHARPCVVDGERFDSQAEARRYTGLQLLERAGAITHLIRQPRCRLSVGNTEIGSYRADFAYLDPDRGLVLEDVKGVDTPLSTWKRRHVAAQYGIVVDLIRRG
jgi:hypothetical protein